MFKKSQWTLTFLPKSTLSFAALNLRETLRDGDVSEGGLTLAALLPLSTGNPRGVCSNGFRLNSSRRPSVLLGLMDANEGVYHPPTKGFLSVHKSRCLVTQLPPGSWLEERLLKISNHWPGSGFLSQRMQSLPADMGFSNANIIKYSCASPLASE